MAIDFDDSCSTTGITRIQAYSMLFLCYVPFTGYF